MDDKLSDLEKALRKYEPLFDDWHSALTKYAKRVIELTENIRKQMELEERRYRFGY